MEKIELHHVTTFKITLNYFQKTENPAESIYWK